MKDLEKMRTTTLNPMRLSELLCSDAQHCDAVLGVLFACKSLFFSTDIALLKLGEWKMVSGSTSIS